MKICYPYDTVEGISRLCETIYFTHGTLPPSLSSIWLFPSLTHISPPPPPVLQYSSDIWQREGRWLGAPRYNSYFMSSILWILNWIFIAYLIWLLYAQSGKEFGESFLLKQASKSREGKTLLWKWIFDLYFIRVKEGCAYSTRLGVKFWSEMRLEGHNEGTRDSR